MKVLAFTDIHGDASIAKDIQNKAQKEGVDLLLCAGDISFFCHGLSNIVGRLDSGIPLLMIPGNHETPAQIDEIKKDFPFVKNIHLKVFKKDAINFFGCGGSGITPFNTPNELEEKDFKYILSNFKPPQSNLVFVTHEPPFNTALDLISNHTGSREIRKFIEKFQPLYCICGHFHENAGKQDKIGNTKILNPGNCAIIEI